MYHKRLLIAAMAALATLSVTTASGSEASSNSSIIAIHAVAEEPKDNVKLGCRLNNPAADDAAVTWKRNDVSISDTEDKYDVKANGTLEVLNVDYLADLGDYECHFDVAGSDNTATVKLNAEPYVNKFDKSKNLVQGDVLTLRCDAYGSPAVSAAWFKDEDRLETDDRTTFEDYENTENGDAVENGVLKISSVDYPDAGDYICSATNEHGQFNSTITIRVKDKLAALWPFLGICAEVLVLCLIIFIYEKRRAKKMAEEDAKEETDHLTNSHANRDDVRQRKV